MMSNDDIAATATYVRRAWGHTAKPVSPTLVRRIRDLNADRTTAWTAAELQQDPEQTK